MPLAADVCLGGAQVAAGAGFEGVHPLLDPAGDLELAVEVGVEVRQPLAPHRVAGRRGGGAEAVDRGLDLVNGGSAAGHAATEDYVKNRYHAPSDEWSDEWDWSGMTADMALFYRLGRSLAESATWPNWHPNDEFRAIRDKSCAPAGGC